MFATDLGQAAIERARDGVYLESEVADVSEERLQRFFLHGTRGYRIRRDLREVVLFATHNLIKDPPFSHLDLICCRNVLIYLNRSIQERVIETFHFALRPGGYLFLGGSEAPDGPNDLFLRLDPDAHIYESRTVTSRVVMPPAEPPIDGAQTAETPPAYHRAPERISPADLHQRILEQYAPPSVVVNEEHNIVHMSDRVGRYLQIRGGEPSRDLLLLVRPELRPDLRSALHQAGRDLASVEVRGLHVLFDDGPRQIDMRVNPVLSNSDPTRGFFVVFFDEHREGPSSDAAATLSNPVEPMTQHLDEEIVRVKAQLRSTIEQYETQAEEAKASNEELQAMNEELRSAAEELETSKEELQSVNEELTTVNQELKVKIEELGLTNNDFQNFVNATDIGTIFLDRALRVKFSTPRAREVFNLRESDIGRLLSDITSRLDDGGIHRDVRTVLDRLSNIERVVHADDDRWHLMRMLPYRTTDNRIDGVVITFQDITDRRRAELQHAKDDLETGVSLRTEELEREARGHEAATVTASNLLRRLVTSQEDERRRIARDLHDDMGQRLTALRLMIERHVQDLPDESNDPLEPALQLIAKIGNDLDFLAWQMRPTALDELGLAAALPRFVTEWSSYVGVPAEFRLTGYERGHLSPDAELAFYRVTQEALNNVAKHAHASRADVILGVNDGQVVLVIEDDGIGFDAGENANSPGFGLLGMRERAALAGAELQIESAPGRGTSVFMRRATEPAPPD